MMSLILYQIFAVFKFHSFDMIFFYVLLLKRWSSSAIWMYSLHPMVPGPRFLLQEVKMRLSLFISVCNTWSCCFISLDMIRVLWEMIFTYRHFRRILGVFLLLADLEGVLVRSFTLIVEHFLEEEVLLETIYGIMKIYCRVGFTYE